MNTVKSTGYLSPKSKKIMIMRKEINLPKEVLSLLKKKAEQDGRSLKNYLEFLCRQAVEAELQEKRREKKNA